MSSDIEGFSQWLNAKLREFNTDESVFGSYINGILEGEESVDEKREALEGILSEIIVSNRTNSKRHADTYTFNLSGTHRFWLMDF